ncbi:MAG: acyl-CoA dehydrogenase family protein [Burkholderiales bacterium]|nr:acyl-CoA dehydrogenase family protein [Burkholderiales bacterium]
MRDMTIHPCTLDADCEALRLEVRTWLDGILAGMPPEKRAEGYMSTDPAFSRALGERGWIGMAWPKRYGGGERSMLERYVVVEELLAAGAPCGAHWVADRQSGPLLLLYGQEQIKQALLPRMARGELYFCIGMSEPNSGSDLASIRSRATKNQDGWLLNGSKIWTSGAHLAQYMIGLFRTGPVSSNRHADLSQFLIDMATPGISVRPIKDLTGADHFNEVFFDNVRIPADHLLGNEGDGWNQVMTELAFERSGPERYLSCIQLLIQMIDSADRDNERHTVAIGKLVAEMATLRQMSLGIAGMLARGENPALPAAIVKDQGTLVEQNLPEIAHDLFGIDLSSRGGPIASVMSYLVQAAPSFSIRGGTRAIVRGIIAKGLGLR